jgi:Clp amino terminal domain, pathogenicity island component/SnoaL-like domain
MFECYTEKARRVVFFARYEASHYGSPYIETEHLLLGLLREDLKTMKYLLPDLKSAEYLRRQIEDRITRGEAFSTAIEVPLSDECKHALKFAAEESVNWGHRHVGTEHLLIGLLQIPTSLAAKVLNADGIDMAKVRDKLRGIKASGYSRSELQPSIPEEGEKQASQQFLVSLREGNWRDLSTFFAGNASFIDADGKLWSGRQEIVANLETLLAPFATKNAKHHLEKELWRTAELWVGTILWDAVHLEAHTFPQKLRMTLVFGNDAGEWSIFLLQITAINEVQTGKPAAC